MTGLNTKLIHEGEPKNRIEGAVTLPIFQTSTYRQDDNADYHDIRYLRLSNSPNHIVLHKKLARLEGGQSALVTSSGMAAISTTLLTLLKAGDHLLAQGGLYGGTHTFITNELPTWGIEYDFVDLNKPDSWQKLVKTNSRVFYVESMTNPLLQVGDLEAVIEFAGQHNMITVIDNTLCAGVNFRPLEHGFDIAVHSATKYLNGHSDIVAGAIIGPAHLVQQIKLKLDHLGSSLDAHACFLLHRGMKTLGLRLAQQNRTTLELAHELARYDAISAVHYPGLSNHADAERAGRLFSAFGGLMSFDLIGGPAKAERLLDKLQLAIKAPSLGGVETLVTLPAKSSHAGLSESERMQLGIGDGLIRVAVGIEDSVDLIDDFKQALNALS